MKKLILLLFFTISIFGCSNDDDVNNSPMIKIDVMNVVIDDTSQDAQTLDFKTNVPWSITMPDTRTTSTWFDVNPKSGDAGNVTLTITITEINDAFKEREGYFGIKTGEKNTSISVKQSKQKFILCDLKEEYGINGGMLFAEDNSFMIIDTKHKNGGTVAIIGSDNCINEDNYLFIEFNDKGQPKHAYTRGVSIEYSNYSTNKCDITVYLKGKTPQHLRDVEFNLEGNLPLSSIATRISTEDKMWLTAAAVSITAQSVLTIVAIPASIPLATLSAFYGLAVHVLIPEGWAKKIVPYLPHALKEYFMSDKFKWRGLGIDVFITLLTDYCYNQIDDNLQISQVGFSLDPAQIDDLGNGSVRPLTFIFHNSENLNYGTPEIKSKDEWIIHTINEFSGKSTITVLANDKSESRTGYVHFRAQLEENQQWYDASLRVDQKGGETSLSVTPTSLKFEGDGGDGMSNIRTVSVNCNTSWLVNFPIERNDWCRFKKVENNRINIWVEPNNSKEIRSCTLTVFTTPPQPDANTPILKQDIIITQEAKKEEMLVEGIELNKDKISLLKGDNETLVATILPDNAANKAVEWLSSDVNVASVTVDGIVKAEGHGSATIRVFSTENPEIYDECTVNVGYGNIFTLDNIPYDPSKIDSDSWIIIDSGDPTTDDFRRLLDVLNKCYNRDISISFSNLNSFPKSALTSVRNLKYIDAPLVVKVYERAFMECRFLTEVNLPLVQILEWRAFYDCVLLKSIDLPKAKDVLHSVFYNCKAMTVANLPQLEIIDSYLFQNCISLKNVSIPMAESIGNSAFENCKSLLSADFPKALSVDASVFYDCSSIIRFNLLSVESVGPVAFYNCSSLKSIDLPSVTAIEWYTEWAAKGIFSGCSSLNLISLPAITSVGDNAFSGCTAVTSIFLPSATYVGKYAFSSCNSLTHIDLPKVITTGERSFYNSALKSISLPEATTIGKESFMSSNSLVEVDFPKVVIARHGAFENCKALTVIKLPRVEVLSSVVFSGCYGLRTITLATESVLKSTYHTTFWHNSLEDVDLITSKDNGTTIDVWYNDIWYRYWETPADYEGKINRFGSFKSISR